jgi:RimJ/RimL family protein N-acetyltransferase
MPSLIAIDSADRLWIQPTNHEVADIIPETDKKPVDEFDTSQLYSVIESGSYVVRRIETMSDDQQLPFPLGHGCVTITTSRGREVHIRHILPEDATLLLELFNRLSPETRRMRFFSPKDNVPAEVLWPEMVRLADINPLVEAALIVTILEAGQERAIGVARLIRDTADTTKAEWAIVLRDDYQGEGLGTVLFDLLLQVAMVRGLKRLWAVSLAENVALHRLVRNSGLPITSQTRRGETTLIISLSDS